MNQRERRTKQTDVDAALDALELLASELDDIDRMIRKVADLRRQGPKS